VLVSLLYLFSMNKYKIIISLIILISGLVILYNGIFPKKLPKDTLVISVATFQAVSENAKDDAINITHRIKSLLTEKNEKGLPIIIKQIEGTIKIKSSNDAKVYCNSQPYNCHIIVWGEVRKDENELYVQPYITAINNYNKNKIKDGNIKPLLSKSIEKIKFKEHVSDTLTDLIILAYGLCYYNNGDYNNAIKIFSHTNYGETQIYKGLSYYMLGDSLRDLGTLVKSRDAFNDILDSNPGIIYKQDELKWRALNYRALTLLSMVEVTSGNKNISLLKKTIIDYNKCNEHFNYEYHKNDWIIIHINLSLAYDYLSAFENKKGNILKAIYECDKLIDSLDNSKDSLYLSVTFNNKGTFLGELISCVASDSVMYYRDMAIESCDKSMQLTSKDTNEIVWIGAQMNKGLIYFTCSNYIRNTNEIKQNLMKSLNTYKDVIEEIGNINDSIIKGRVYNLYALTLLKYSTDYYDEKGLEEVVASLNKTLQFYASNKKSKDWADAQELLAITYRTLSTRKRGQEIYIYRKAIDNAKHCIDSSKIYYDSINYPEKYKKLNSFKDTLLLLEVKFYK